MNRIHYRYRPAVYARSDIVLPFRVDWRSHGLQGISTNDQEDAEVWRWEVIAAGYNVVEYDAITRKSEGGVVSKREQLAREIEGGRGDFSYIDRRTIAKALRTRKRRPMHPVERSKRLKDIAHLVKTMEFDLERSWLSRHQRYLIRDYLDNVIGW